MDPAFRTSLVVTLTAALLLCKDMPAVAVHGAPDPSSFDKDTRDSIDLACGVAYANGPAAYAECLRAQLQSIGIQPDATHVQSARPKHTNRKAARTSLSPSTDRSQATPREHRTAYSPWEDPGFWALVAVGVVLFIYLTPVLWVLLSSRSRGGAKLGWFLVVLFFSWLGLAVFLIVTQAQRNRSDAY